MARKTQEFDSFGVRYRVTQMPAAEAFQFLFAKDDPDPIAMLSGAFIRSERGWIALDSAEAVDTYVRDTKNTVQPRLVLSGLIALVSELNWGFLKGRAQVKVPSYLRSNSDVRQVEGVSPVMGALMAADKASLRELEEYYSLEDAFRIYDVICNDQLNKAQAQYDAVQAAKSKK